MNIKTIDTERLTLVLPAHYCHNWGRAGRLLLFFSIILTLASCRNQRSALSGFQDELRPVEMRYSSLLESSRADSFTLCCVRNPWHENAYLASYVLVDRDKPLPGRLPEGTIVRTPIEKAVICSSVHCALLEDLNAEGALKGVTDAQYMHLDYVDEGLRRGTIQDCGTSAAPLVERIALLDADAVFLSPYEDGSQGASLRGLGIPLIQCADYMETSSLARAEWARFFGLLLGRSEESEDMFHEVASRYEDLKSRVLASHGRPGVFCDLKTGSVWYQPGGGSTMGQIFQDAGARYILSDDTHSGSLPMSFEQVLSLADTASVWLLKYSADRDYTYSGLAQEADGYMRFEAWRNKRIFGCNTSHVPFYEKEPFHPDLLLRNLVGILHPEILTQGDDEVRFYTPIE